MLFTPPLLPRLLPLLLFLPLEVFLFEDEERKDEDFDLALEDDEFLELKRDLEDACSEDLEE